MKSFTKLESRLGIHERKEREKEQRREDILDAAQRVFFEKGLQSATMDEIADTAELSKGTLYLYYSSKEDLYLAVMMRGMLILHEMFKARISTEPTTLQAIVGIMDTLGEFFHLHPKYFRMMNFLQNTQFHSQISDEMRESISRVNQDIWNLAINLFQRGIEEGILASDLKAGETAVAIWSSATSLMMRIDLEYDMWKNRMKIDLKEVLRISNSLLLDAILTPQAKVTYGAMFDQFHPRVGSIV